MRDDWVIVLVVCEIAFLRVPKVGTDVVCERARLDVEYFFHVDVPMRFGIIKAPASDRFVQFQCTIPSSLWDRFRMAMVVQCYLRLELEQQLRARGNRLRGDKVQRFCHVRPTSPTLRLILRRTEQCCTAFSVLSLLPSPAFLAFGLISSVRLAVICIDRNISSRCRYGCYRGVSKDIQTDVTVPYIPIAHRLRNGRKSHPPLVNIAIGICGA